MTDGRFSFDHINPGGYMVYIESSQGGGAGQVTVAPGATETLDITLSANGTVIGKLVDEAGKPASGMKVVIRDGNVGEMVRPPVTSAADGSFRIDHAPGRCDLGVLRTPDPPFIKHDLVIEPGKLLDVGSIVLDALSIP